LRFGGGGEVLSTRKGRADGGRRTGERLQASLLSNVGGHVLGRGQDLDKESREIVTRKGRGAMAEGEKKNDFHIVRQKLEKLRSGGDVVLFEGWGGNHNVVQREELAEL